MVDGASKLFAKVTRAYYGVLKVAIEYLMLYFKEDKVW